MRLILLWCLFLYASAEISSSPLCKVCKCQEEKSVFCEEGVFPEEIYKNDSWKDGNNVSYPIIALSLQQNRINSISRQFPESTLISLDLGSNMIENISDEVFANLQKLEILLLDRNNLRDLKPAVFKGVYMPEEYYPLRSLSTLNLSSNKITSLNQDLFEHIPKLRRLFLYNNPFGILDESTQIALGSLAFLEELDLSSTHLKELPEHFLHTPKFLIKLDLSYNLFEAVPKTLKDSHSLQRLNFDGNPIVNLTHKLSFPHVKTLKHLSLCNMPLLQEIGPHAFGNLHNLKELQICNNTRLQFIHKSAMNRKLDGDREYLELRKIHLQNNNITSLDKHLLYWEEVNDFDVSGNPFTCDCKSEWLIKLVGRSSSMDGDGPHIHHIKKIRCSSPDNYKNITFLEAYHFPNMDCTIEPPSVHSYILLGTTLGMTFIVLIMGILIFLYRKKQIPYRKLKIFGTPDTTTHFFNNASQELETNVQS